jgi:N6-L-threonylcarbamoyladenine synthase
MQAAKGLSMALAKPLIGVHHLEAHLAAAAISEGVQYPCLGCIVSGGHTTLLYCPEPYKYELLGETVDDAMGEAFDKVAKMLDLPYPGGPALEELARSGNPHRFPFKPGVVKGSPFDFSFSGLKTSFLYALRAQKTLDDATRADLAASFQEAAVQAIASRVQAALERYPAAGLLVGGGVSQNRYLRQALRTVLGERLWLPGPGLCADNGAMIAVLGYQQYMRGLRTEPSEVRPRLPMGVRR